MSTPKRTPKRTRKPIEPTLESYLTGKHSSQTVLNFVTKKLIEQGRPSFSPSVSACAYRGGDGCKCAIGHMIPDNLYRPDMELNSVWTVTKLAYGREPTDLPHSRRSMHEVRGRVTFLSEMQTAHDEAAESPNFIEDLKWRLGELADKYDLTRPKVLRA